MAEPLPGEAEAAGLVAGAAAALARDPRVDPARIGALGFGIGARAVALAAAEDSATFAARLLLYPGCAGLADLLCASPHARRTAPSPVLVLHGEDDPANAPEECEALSAVLAPTGWVRRISYRGATYARDLPQTPGNPYAAQPWPGRGGTTVPMRSWPELAELTAAQAAGFLALALHAAAVRPE